MITAFVTWFQGQYAFHGHAWIVEVFLILLLAFMIVTGIKITYHTLLKRSEKTDKLHWHTIFLKSTQKPLDLFVWLLALTVIGDVLGVSFKETAFFTFDQYIRRIGFIFLLVWALIRFVNEAEIYFLLHAKKKVDKTTINAVTKIIKASIVLLGFLMALQSVGIGISGVVAFGGVSGAAVAFAAKDLLANFFGGLIIYLDRPFAVGDSIRSPDKNIEGTVEHIGWRLCRLRTADKTPLYVPNALFTTISLENTSRMSHRHLKTMLGLRYEDAEKISGIVDAIALMLRSNKEIDQQAKLLVNFVRFGTSSLDIAIDCFVKTTDQAKFQQVQQEIFFKCLEIIKAFKAECAYPSTTIYTRVAPKC
jgi:MscS family membrane protein